jgi:hypothetical protein
MRGTAKARPASRRALQDILDQAKMNSSRATIIEASAMSDKRQGQRCKLKVKIAAGVELEASFFSADGHLMLPPRGQAR